MGGRNLIASEEHMTPVISIQAGAMAWSILWRIQINQIEVKRGRQPFYRKLALQNNMANPDNPVDSPLLHSGR
jgi:hypothetical protein